MTRNRPPTGRGVGRRFSQAQRIGTPDNLSCGDRVDTLRSMSTALEVKARTEIISDRGHFRVDFTARNVSLSGVSGAIHTHAWLIRDDVVVAVDSGPGTFALMVRSSHLEPGDSTDGAVNATFTFCADDDPQRGVELLIRYALGPASGLLQLPWT